MRLLAAVILFVFCWIATTNTRLEAYNGDPFSYLYAAQTLRAGEGLRNYDFDDPFAQTIAGPANAPFTTWPPLYPMILSLFGADLYAARALNAVSLWVTLILMWILYGDYGVWRSVRIATGIVYLALLVGDRQTLLSASSEALFYPLVLAFLIALPRVTDKRWFIVTVFLAVALPMTRYIGVSFVIVGAACVFWRCGLMAVLAYTLPSVTAFSLWAARNILLTGTFTGNTQPGAYASLPIAADIWEITLTWTQAIIALSLPLVLPWVLWALWRWYTSQRLSSAG